MAFVGMPGPGVVTQGAEHADATGAEEPLLTQTEILSTAIETTQQCPVVGVILLEIGIEEVEWDTPDLRAPSTDVDGPVERLHGRQIGRSINRRNGSDWNDPRIDDLIGVLLPSIETQSLVEVSLSVEESESNQGHPEVGGRLAMIPSQDP
jgi:hypothetical protein